MQIEVENILADLYQADPSLRAHDAALRKLVVELVELRPNAQMDEAFRRDLRRRLLSMAETNTVNKSLIDIFMKNFQFVGAGVAVFALLVAGAWYLNGINGGPGDFTSMMSVPQISKTADNAFGSLASLTATGARNQSGGGSATAMSDAPTMAPATEVSAMPVGGGMGGGGDAKMIAPNPVTFNYVYVGEEIALAQDRVDVLKRVKNAGNSGLADFVSRFSQGLVDLNSFQDAQLQGFTFAENRDRGYQVSVQLNEGTIYINEYWEKWQSLTCPAMMSSERFMGCPEPRRLKPEDVPADDVVIAAATSFLDSHGISRASYGEPRVNDQWRMIYAKAEDKSSVWIPDMVTVAYPLLINGQMVHDESGNPTGLSVTVRISPEVAVSSVYDLNTLTYESSSYEAVTDVERVMGLVKKGGFRNYNYVEPGAKVVDVELGTPEVSLVKLWDYRYGKNEELLVPALVFPVVKEPSADDVGPWGWYRKSVIIPLVKEILDNEDGGPVVMPLEDGPAAETPAEGTETPAEPAETAPAAL